MALFPFPAGREGAIFSVRAFFLSLKTEACTMTRPVPELSPDQWPELRKARGSAKTAWSYFSHLVKTMHRELGEEKTAEVLKAFMSDNAKRFFLPGMKGFGIHGNDAWSIASYFKLATGDVIGYKAELVEEEPGKVVYRLYPPCIWFPDLDIPASFCQAMGCFETEAVKLVNPSITVSSRKLMTAGDDCCELVFEEKKG
jgi:hypothetical protein